MFVSGLSKVKTGFTLYGFYPVLYGRLPDFIQLGDLFGKGCLSKQAK